MATTFTGPLGVTIFRAAAIKSALNLWDKAGIKVNSAWTPRAMMKAAESITGEKFKARDYKGAAKALEKWLEANKVEAIKSGAVS